MAAKYTGKDGGNGHQSIARVLQKGSRRLIARFINARSEEVKRPNAVGIADDLDARANIMIRDGAFCVHSYLNGEFGQGWLRPRLPSEHRMTYRVSLYFYNTLAECEDFVQAIGEVFEERGYV